MLFTTDEVGSDDLEAILEFTAQEAAGSSSSRTPATSSTLTNGNHAYSKRQELNGRLSALEAELGDVDAQIAQLKDLRAQIVAEKQRVAEELSAQGGPRLSLANSMSSSKGKGKVASAGTINYMTELFEWSGELKARMKEVFSISSFRLCQEGVCNASMDGRDIVCVMPTGGGKSLTYQLPALLNPGCTLVISPLISLITDQILHLREFGVEAVMLMGSTSKEESRDIFSRLASTANGNRNGMGGPEIKLCYVTPEKIAKSKTFTSMLEKLANAGKLSRIVIDEAHCVSQLGHDFRPDYKKLSILRQLFPRVPILALSATCPPKVLKDLLLTLRLKPVVGGTAASPEGTVYFSAPLYRKNLHYRVVPKPSSASAVIKTMAEYVLEQHPDQSGIVYCLSKKDTETVAQGLSDESGGRIRTGVYHADVHDRDKADLHRRWRKGDIKVVCATIAFGLGIDKGDVRFVLHHSMSKSLEGYYQESGRAGRDGKDSDCVLYFRPQDASRLSALVCGELEGQGKLQDMLRFAMDIEECRKLQFARYFSTSASLSMSAWGTAETDAHARCGHCDNCVRSPESVEKRDVTLCAWQILRVAQAIEREGGRVTLGMLADLVRGAGGGAFGVAGRGRGGGRGRGRGRGGGGGGGGKVGLDLDDIAGGKVTLGKDETETLLVNLVLLGHLGESFHSTAYTINVYVSPGPNALRLVRYERTDVEGGKGPRVELAFMKKTKGAAAKKAAGKGAKLGDSETGSKGFITGAKGKKRKRSVDEVNEDGEEDGDRIEEEEDDAMSLYADDDDENGFESEFDSGTKSKLVPRKSNASNASTSRQPISEPVQDRRRSNRARVVDDDEEDEFEDDWKFTMNVVKSSKPVAPSIPAPKLKPKGFFTPHITPLTGLSGGSKAREARRQTPLTQAKLPVSLGNDVIQIISDSE